MRRSGQTETLYMRRSVSIHALTGIRTYKGCPDDSNKQGRIKATYLFIRIFLNNVSSGVAVSNLGRGTDYVYCGFSWHSSAPLGELGLL